MVSGVPLDDKHIFGFMQAQTQRIWKVRNWKPTDAEAPAAGVPADGEVFPTAFALRSKQAGRCWTNEKNENLEAYLRETILAQSTMKANMRF